MRIVEYTKLNLNSRPILSIALACLLAGLLAGARPMYQVFKGWRSDRLIAKSQISLEKESFTEAFTQAHTATLLDNDEEAARNFAQVAVKVGYPLSHELWQGLIDSPFAETSDWQKAIEASVRVGDTGKAFEYLLKWKRSGKVDQAAYDASHGIALYASGQIAESKAILLNLIERGVIEEEPTRLYNYLVSTFGSQEEREDLRLRISDWAGRQDEVGKLALLTIVQDESRSPEDLQQAAARLLEHPLSNFSDRLNVVAFQVKRGWKDRDSLAEMYDGHVASSDKDYLAQYTTLLCDLGQYDEVLELVDYKKSLEERVVLRNWLVAKLGVGATDEVLSSTGSDDVRSTSLAEESLLRALALKESGDQTGYESNLFQSISKAGGDDVLFLETHFKRLGASDALLQLYTRLTEHRSFGQQARILLFNLAIAERNEAYLATALDGLTPLSPSRNSDLLPRTIYVRLLLGLEVEQARHAAENLVSYFPQNSTYRLLLAFAHLKSANITQARELTQFYPENEQAIDPRNALLLSALWNEFNDREKAQRYAQQVDTKILLPSEAKLLNSILGS